jgi:hypothetical protein
LHTKASNLSVACGRSCRRYRPFLRPFYLHGA